MPVQLHLFLVGAFSLKEKGRLLQWVVFLVGAFSLKEKSPTITRGSFFSRRFSSEKCPTITVTSFCFVRLQSHSDWSTFYNFHDPLIATLVASTGTWHRGYGFFKVCQAEGRGFESNLDQKFVVQVFFGFVILFFAIFFNAPKGPPSFFPILQKNGCSKTPKGPLLHFSALRDLPRDLPETKKISKKFGFLFNFFLTRVL